MDTIVQPGSLDSEAGIFAMSFDKSGGLSAHDGFTELHAICPVGSCSRVFADCLLLTFRGLPNRGRIPVDHLRGRQINKGEADERPVSCVFKGRKLGAIVLKRASCSGGVYIELVGCDRRLIRPFL